MPERPLFHLKNLPLDVVYQKGLLFVFALFMIVGNFFRFLPISGFPSSVSLIEMLLYALSIPLYFLRFRKSFLFLIVLMSSTLYGILLYGFDGASCLYSIKLMGMIAAGVCVGEALKKDEGIVFLIKIFVSILLLGFVIFTFFPKASLFFSFLENVGIRFLGDPHERRFISSFFDPNYYAAIAIIPMILTWHLRAQKVYFFLSLLFFLSIILTFSRSGIFTALLVMLAGVAVRMGVFRIRPLRFILPLCFLALPFFFYDEFAYFLNRTINFIDEPSAMNRWMTFGYGWEFFLRHPLFGIGYNNLPLLLREEACRIAIDSSPLTLFVTLGSVPTAFFILYFIIWTFKKWKNFSLLFKWLYIYLLISMLFTSQFNNLLFYPFWLIPVIALFVYENRYCS